MYLHTKILKLIYNKVKGKKKVDFDMFNFYYFLTDLFYTKLIYKFCIIEIYLYFMSNVFACKIFKNIRINLE